MNRRFFLRSLFAAVGGISTSGLWLPEQPFTILHGWTETTCTRRVFSKEYIEALHNDGKPLDLDEVFRILYAIKKSRPDNAYIDLIVPIEDYPRCKHLLDALNAKKISIA